jgi:hypothetical protein
MSLSRLLRSLLLLFIVTQCAATNATAQWRMVHVFGSPISCVKFLGDIGQPDVGFVGAGSYIYRTSDGGSTWTNVLRVTGGQASSFCFKDALVGWCTLYGLQTGYACYVTFDGGKSWQALSPTGEGCDVYFNQSSRVLLLSLRSGFVMSSTNDGLTWNGSQAGMNGFVFGTGSSGICSTTGNVYGATSDGGLSWTFTNAGLHSWSPSWIPGTTRYVAPGDLTQNVYRSEDLGASWLPSGRVAGLLTGCAQSTECATYVQSSVSMFVSTNVSTWNSIGGPGNDYDTRFCISGQYLYAGDIDGQLWRIPAATTAWPSLQFDQVPQRVVTSPGCSIDTLPAIFHNLTCTGVTILSASLTDTTRWHLLPQDFPLTIDPSDSVRLALFADPSGGGLFISQLKIELQNSNGISDTTIQLTLDASHILPPVIDSLKLAIVQCSALDTMIRVRNQHCDSLTLTSVTLLDTSVFEVQNQILPVSIAPDSEVIVSLRLTSQFSGTFVSRLRLEFQYRSLSIDTIIRMTVTVRDAIPSASLSTAIVRFDTVTMCDERERSVTIRNTGCDAVLVTELQLNADPDITLVPLPLPVRIPAGDSLPVQLRLTPQRVGTPSAHLDLMLLNGIVERLYSVDVTGTVTESKHGVSLLPSRISVDSLLPCSSWDTVLVLRNLSGCDSMMIDQVMTNEPDISLSTDPILPAVIRSSDSLVIHVHLGTSTTDVTSSIRILGASFDSTVPFHATFRSDVTDHLTLASDRTSFLLHRCDLDSATLKIGAQGCALVDVDSVWIDGASCFTLPAGRSLTQLVPGTSADVSVYVSGEPGSYAGTAHVRDSRGEIHTIQLLATILPVDTTALALRIASGASASPHAGAATATEVYFERAVTGQSGLTDITCDLTFDRDVLGETQIVPSNGWSAVMTGQTAHSISVSCHRALPTAIAQDEILFSVLQRATVSTTLDTRMTLSNVAMMPGVPRYAECTLAMIVDTTGLNISLANECDDSTLSRFIGGKQIISGIHVFPNPVVAGESLTIEFSAGQQCNVSLSLIDINGRTCRQTVVPAILGKNKHVFNAHSLASGNYVCRIETRGQVANVPVTLTR